MSNTRFLILPECHLPNLANRAMKLCLARLSEDWQAAWQHPVVLAESFVDPQLFRGTAYKVSGWINPGATAGFARHAADYYVAHDRPKQLWVRELVPRARGQLRAEKLPPAWAVVEAAVPPRCRDSTKTLRALTAHLNCWAHPRRGCSGDWSSAWATRGWSGRRRKNRAPACGPS